MSAKHLVRRTMSGLSAALGETSTAAKGMVFVTKEIAELIFHFLTVTIAAVDPQPPHPSQGQLLL